MARGRSRAWWEQTVSRWRASGLPASEFAARAGVSERTLRGRSSTLRRDTRAVRGSTARGSEPIEIALPPVNGAPSQVEIALEGAVLRFDVGADVEYLRALVLALRGEAR